MIASTMSEISPIRPTGCRAGELCIRLDGIHWRLDSAWCHRIYSNAALGILDCERFGCGIKATLRQHRQHGGYAGDGVVDEARCDLYDMAAAPLLHLGDGELRDVKEASDVDAQDRRVVGLG